MHIGKVLGTGLLAILAVTVVIAGEGDLPVAVGLRCENRENPVGMDAVQPRFSWQMRASGRGQRQMAYRILVSSTPELLAAQDGDVWDSGKVESDQSVAVRYGGIPLHSVTYYYWKVMLWDKEGRETQWSEVCSFMTGKLTPDSWHGKWIGNNAYREILSEALGSSIKIFKQDEARWMQVDLGESRRLDQVILHPVLNDDYVVGGFTRGYAFPFRFRIETADEEKFKNPRILIDQMQADYPNPGNHRVIFNVGGQTGRYVRVTATKLWPRAKDGFMFALAELEVMSGGRNVAAGVKATCPGGAEGFGWSMSQLTDGKGLVLSDEELKRKEPVKNPHGAIYLRKTVGVKKVVKRATVFFCGLGFSELAIDGKKVGDYYIGPGFTTYDKRAQYLAFDVTEAFCKPGSRQLDVTLVDGWYALDRDPWVHGFHRKPFIDLPKLLLDLHLEYVDGSEAVVTSDESWKWSEGEITRSTITQEDVDLREAGDARRNWKPVTVVKGPAGRLVCQKEPFNRIIETVLPVSMSYDPVKREAIWDFGREINGWVRFQAAGPAGNELKVITVPDGLTKRTSLFTLAGKGGKECYEPRFFHVGMRRVQVQGLLTAPATNDLSACVVSSMYKPSGDFRCSDEVMTSLHEAVRRTIVNYTTFLPNDPVREWKAWSQDIQNMFWSSAYLFDSQAMYERWQFDLLDGQAEDGNCPNIAPGPGFDGYNSPWWGGCVVWLPWEWYQYYGDDSLLRESYPAMKRYVAFLEKKAVDGLQKWGLEDWMAIETTPATLINTPAAYHYVQVVSRTARLLGDAEEADQYRVLADKIRENFNRVCLDSSTGIYGLAGGQPKALCWSPPVKDAPLHEVWWTGDRPCTQAAQVMALALGLAPVESRSAIGQVLCREIAAHKMRLSTGFVSTPYLLKVLADLDPEAGWTLTSTRDYPSWYYMTFGKGGDVMKETWGGGQALMPSLGGNIATWNMESLAGIRPDPDGPGFKKIIIKPNVVGDLKWVECWYNSPYGKIVSNWKCDGMNLVMDVTVPVNASATVYIPADSASVKESGKPASGADSVKFLKMENGRSVYEVGSGCYMFTAVVHE